jgi:20S proteasome subunit alpha 5
MEIDSHVGCAMSGLTADARTMVDHARVTSQMHAFTYDEPIGVESCTQAVCDLALRFGESVEDDDALMVSLGQDVWIGRGACGSGRGAALELG